MAAQEIAKFPGFLSDSLSLCVGLDPSRDLNTGKVTSPLTVALSTLFTPTAAGSPVSTNYLESLSENSATLFQMHLVAGASKL